MSGSQMKRHRLAKILLEIFKKSLVFVVHEYIRFWAKVNLIFLLDCAHKIQSEHIIWSGSKAESDFLYPRTPPSGPLNGGNNFSHPQVKMWKFVTQKEPIKQEPRSAPKIRASNRK